MMKPTEPHSEGVTDPPDPGVPVPAIVASFPSGQAIGDDRDPVRWLLDCCIDGLLHCACTHNAMHPDLIDCIDRRAAARTAMRENQP